MCVSGSGVLEVLLFVNRTWQLFVWLYVSDKFKDTVKFVHDLLRSCYYSSRYKGLDIEVL